LSTKISYKLGVVIVALLGCFTVQVKGQSTINSPYSFFGIGDLYSDGLVKNLSMGDTKYAIFDAFHANPANPASYSSLETTTFNVAFNVQSNRLSSDNVDQRYDEFGLRYFSLGLPVAKRFGLALGLTPVSRIGYNISNVSVVENEVIESSYTGSGGVSKVYIGGSYSIVKDSLQTLSLGGNLGYYFGPIQNTRYVEFPNNTSAYTSYVNSRENVSDLRYTLGLQYRRNISRLLTSKQHLERYISVGGSYNFAGDMNTRREYFATSLSGSAIRDSVSFIRDTGAIYIPEKWGAGITFELHNSETNRRLLLAADYEFSPWSQMEKFDENQNLNDAWQSSFGIEFFPDDEATRGFLKMMRYRAGFRYGQSYYKVQEQDINYYGISFGLGLPLVKSRSAQRFSSSINLGVEYGQRAFDNTGLIDEQFTTFTVGITLSPGFWDKWFVTKKIE
tara:strand:+ start:2366 stop:3709 length:1344 start_codon:yes stop_codon:yes gene_type:complete